MTPDAWKIEDPTRCETCGREGCEDHVAPIMASTAPQPDAASTEAKRESQATTIVRLVKEAGTELWHTGAGDGYLTVQINGHSEHYSLTSRTAKDYVSR